MMNLNLNPALQLVLDDSDRIKQVLQGFKPVLEEISAVCDTSLQQERLDQIDQQVFQMQHKISEPLEHFLQAVGVKNLSDFMLSCC